MLEQVRLAKKRRGDQGAAVTILVIGMALALVFVSLLMFRIANANDMRTRAQRAADAAAIAAVTPMRDMAVDWARSGVDPEFISLFWVVPDITIGNPLYRQRADEYAEQNGAELDTSVHPPVRPSGFDGRTMKAWVRTQDCQVTEEREDVPDDKECRDRFGRRGVGRKGNADAVAQLRDYNCEYFFPVGASVASRLICDGVEVWHNGIPAPIEQVRRVFEIDLVADEDPVEYIGLLGGALHPDAGHGPPVVAGEGCPSNITARMCALRNAVAQLFRPLEIGCYRPGSSGEHPLGRACDFMVSPIGTTTPAGHRLGTLIANWAVANAERYGIYYVIWEQKIWNIQRAGEGWRLMENRGSITQNHFDHPHISVLP